MTPPSYQQCRQEPWPGAQRPGFQSHLCCPIYLVTSAVTSLLYLDFLIQEMDMDILNPICPGGWGWVMMRKH